MRLIEHLSEVNCSSRNPAFIREALISRGITPSIGQVRQALKSLLATQSQRVEAFNCPICPNDRATAATHDQTYHDHLQQDLASFKAMLSQTPAGLATESSLPTYMSERHHVC
jgi:hypothetical protein